MSSPLDKYADIQALVQKEATDIARKVYKEEANKYKIAQEVPLHRHNGFDAPKVKIQDLEGMMGTSGSIEMSTTNTRYFLGLNAATGFGITPSSVRFNGCAFRNPGGGIDVRSMVVGDAFIGTSFYYQPESSTSVTIGGKPQVVVQSSTALTLNHTGSGNPSILTVSEGHIVSVEFPANTVVARATIPDLAQNAGADASPIQNGTLAIDVTLASGWSIIGNFMLV